MAADRKLPLQLLSRFSLHTSTYGWILVVCASVLLHAFFAYHQPFTNDEGAYLYDARTVLQGSLPGGDALVKTPVAILLFSASEFITSQSLFAARAASVLASVLSAWPLFVFMNRIAGRKAAQYAALLWLFGSGPIILQSMGHTQAIANFFIISALASIISRRAALAGVCMALAYASRKISIAVVAPVAIMFLFDKTYMRASLLRPFLSAACLLIGIYALGGYVFYGMSGAMQALGVSYGNIVTDQAVSGFTIPAWGGGIDRFASVVFRTGLPYILLAGAACVIVFRMLFSRNATGTWIAIPVAHLAALGLLYAAWPVLLPEYFADFLIPLTMIGAFVLSHRYSRSSVRYAIGIGAIVASLYSLASVYAIPWTGMFSRDAIFATAGILRERVQMDEEIFTAAVIIPYVSGHSVPLHVSHPQWYQYDFISSADKESFLPDYERVMQSPVSWAVREQLTDYAYRGVPFHEFSLVETIGNNTIYRNNPLMIYAK